MTIARRRGSRLAAWRSARRLASRSRPPHPAYEPSPFPPGLPIVWSPGIAASAVRELLDTLGVGRATLPAYLEMLGIQPRGRHVRDAHGRPFRPAGGMNFERPAAYYVPCPSCARLCRRLFWGPEGFRGPCCASEFQHGVLCWGGRHRCRRRISSRAALRSADYVFACNVRAARAARKARWAAARRLSGLAPRSRGLGDVLRFVTVAAAIVVPPPRRVWRAPPGPLVNALGGELLDVVVHDVLSIPAYAARVRSALDA